MGNAGLVVLAVIQLIVALSLANLVARRDSPPLMLTSFLQGPISTVLCLSDIPLLGQVPSSVIPPWSSNGDVERTEGEQVKRSPSSLDGISSLRLSTESASLSM